MNILPGEASVYLRELNRRVWKMEKRTNRFANFTVRLVRLWLQQADLLVRNIKKSRNIAFTVLIIGIIFFALLGISIDIKCSNGCGIEVPNSAAHYIPCDNCPERVWYCDNHPHKTICGHCSTTYWDCPLLSEADKHSQKLCVICNTIHSPCEGHQFFIDR